MTARPTIVVTGGAGYIGSHVLLALRDAGWPVVAVDNLVTGVAGLVPEDVPLVKADCGDADRMRALLAEHAAGAVMHFAASTVVPESVADPMKYYLNNAVNTARLIEACIGAGVGKCKGPAQAFRRAEGNHPVSSQGPVVNAAGAGQDRPVCNE